MHGCTLVAVSLLAASAAAQSTQVEVPADQPYTHAPSGMIFPPTIPRPPERDAKDVFVRREIDRYDAAGRNVSASYRIAGERVGATVYVYPSKGLDFAAHFVECRSLMLRSLGETAALVSSTDDERVTNGGATLSFRHAIATGTIGEKDEKVASQSELYLIRLGDWCVKYRITYPASAAEHAAAHAKELVSMLALPMARAAH